ncbi:MAG: hypothetical protein LBV52_00515, partial [Spirochaetaceae bacterium]|nr:hypothetical protein [Spirochaetaceae bacterium]
MKDKNITLCMHLAGGGFGDLYPYELSLRESFSNSYMAQLTVLSATAYKYEDLADILDKGVSISVSQRVGQTDLLRTRY